MLKKTIILITISLITAALTACGAVDIGSSASDTTAQTAEQESGVPADQSLSNNDEGGLQESQNGTADESSATATTEFTVEIYPAVDSMQPVEDPYLTFTLLDIPDEWTLEEQDMDSWQSYSYNYYNQDGSLVAIIQGGREAADPENPLADVWEAFDSTVSIGEIDISAYSVMLHIMFLDYTEPQSYAYHYYVNAGGRLVEIEFWAPDNTPGTREQFDAIVASFKMA